MRPAIMATRSRWSGSGLVRHRVVEQVGQRGDQQGDVAVEEQAGGESAAVRGPTGDDVDQQGCSHGQRRHQRSVSALLGLPEDLVDLGDMFK